MKISNNGKIYKNNIELFGKLFWVIIFLSLNFELFKGSLLIIGIIC